MDTFLSSVCIYLFAHDLREGAAWYTTKTIEINNPDQF